MKHRKLLLLLRRALPEEARGVPPPPEQQWHIDEAAHYTAGPAATAKYSSGAEKHTTYTPGIAAEATTPS